MAGPILQIRTWLALWFLVIFCPTSVTPQDVWETRSMASSNASKLAPAHLVQRAGKIFTASSITLPTGCAYGACASCETPAPTAKIQSHSKHKRNLLIERTLRGLKDYGGSPGSLVQKEFQAAKAAENKKPLDESYHILPHKMIKDGEGTASAEFYPLGKKPFSMFVDGLWGCVSVVVMSEKGVYMSHFWEIPGFKKKEGFLQPSTQQKFEAEVLRPLKSGTTHADGIARYAEGAFSSCYNPLAFVIRPNPWNAREKLSEHYAEEDEDESDDYNEAVRENNAEVDKLWRTIEDFNQNIDQKVQQISSTVKSILGVNAKSIYYERTDAPQSASAQTAAGKILFQYDPVQSVGPDCGNQAIARLYIANRPEIGQGMQWEAHEDQ